MPITPATKLRRIAQQAFHETDYLVTGLAFEVHRALGPWFLDESIYRDELARLCKAKGLSVSTEFPVSVTFGTFLKPYFIDLLVNDSIVYELKAVEAIHPIHRNQALHYLMLTGLSHGKILNMRCASVEYEFVSTTINAADRYAISFDCASWCDVDDDSRWLKETVCSLVQDWGLFLDVTLFYDAIEHLRGSANVIGLIEIRCGNQVAGRQRVHLLNPQTAFKITDVSKDVPQFERHMLKFLSLTSLRAIQWVNFNRHDVVLKTLVNHKGS